MGGEVNQEGCHAFCKGIAHSEVERSLLSTLKEGKRLISSGLQVFIPNQHLTIDEIISMNTNGNSHETAETCSEYKKNR
jgi:hypothetical protein